MADIFISYCNADIERVRALVRLLEDRGWTVWWDRRIPPGHTFADFIYKAITAARCILVIWSTASVNSKWVRKEVAEGEKRGIIIPVLFDKVNIPFEFRDIQAAALVDYPETSQDTELNRLLDAIVSIAGEPIRKAGRAIPDDVPVDNEEHIEWEQEPAAAPSAGQAPMEARTSGTTKAASREKRQSSSRKTRLKAMKLAGLIFVVLSILFLLSISWEFVKNFKNNRAYERARSTDTMKSYEDFMRDYPVSFNTNKAITRYYQLRDAKIAKLCSSIPLAIRAGDWQIAIEKSEEVMEVAKKREGYKWDGITRSEIEARQWQRWAYKGLSGDTTTPALRVAVSEAFRKRD